MKRLLAIALVGLLVVSAGCGMTSPEADQAREGQQTTTTTAPTTDSGESNPSETTPIQAVLPDGYSKSGIENPSVAYEQHEAVLANNSFQLTYLHNDSSGATPQTRMAITNGSGPAEKWHTTIGLRTGPISAEIYQAGDTRYEQRISDNGTVTATSTSEPFAIPDGALDNESVVGLLEKMTVSSPRTMTRGNTTFVFYKVDQLGSTPVEGGHLVVMPSGQIRIIYLKYHSTEIAYTSTVGGDVSIEQPAWVQNATADS